MLRIVICSVAFAVFGGVALPESLNEQGPESNAAQKNTSDYARTLTNRIVACWHVDLGAFWSETTVTVGFDLDIDGRVLNNEIRLLATDGDAAATRLAFNAARMAILRCQLQGYDLPRDQHEEWKSIELTFDLSGQ